MGFVGSLRHLWRHRRFRRLLWVRVTTQSADGVLQVALATYVLFSPQRQPDAASIAAVLAITLLPFSILGPFVGVVLDRWSRRQVLVVTDVIRAALAVGLALLVGSGVQGTWTEIVFYAAVLVAMSVNRFLLAGLSAALPHTIDPGEYMTANAVMPTIGPIGAVLGVGVGTGLRVGLGPLLPPGWADGLLFGLAGAGFAASAVISAGFQRRELGPDTDAESAPPTRIRTVLSGLAEAFAHLAHRRQAGLGLLAIFGHRLAYGVVTVAMILVFRNYLHPRDAVGPALADLGLLAVCTAAGFVAAAAVTPPVSVRLGVRWCVVAGFVLSAVFQLVPGAVFARLPLLAAGFLLGVTAQSIKLCVDTLVQAHVDDEFKGRVFVLYDMAFNVALVVAAGIAALILPADGRSVPVLVVLAAIYLALGLAFAAVTRGLAMDAGTESLRTAPVDGAG